MSVRPPKLLVLGIRHAVRAPMAEAIFRARVGDAVDLVSAGMEPSPLHPLTTQVLEEAGFTLHAHAPRSAKTLLGRSSFNTVILMAGKHDHRPPRMFFGALESETWPVDDPSIAPEPERLAAFRQCREQLVHLVDGWVAEHPALQRQPRVRDTPTPSRALRIPKPKLI